LLISSLSLRRSSLEKDVLEDAEDYLREKTYLSIILIPFPQQDLMQIQGFAAIIKLASIICILSSRCLSMMLHSALNSQTELMRNSDAPLIFF